jgi:dihydrofolate reductase
MRRIRYGVASSLDGYIAGPNGEADWIVMDPEIDFGAIFEQFDTLLIGRRTWEGMMRAGGGGGGGGGFGSMEIFVFSTTLDPAAQRGVRIVRDDVEGTLRELRAKPGKDIWLFGGGELFRSLLSLDQVDGVDVAISPVLLGSGIPLLPSPAVERRLELTEHRVYEKSGIISLSYAVKPESSGGRRSGRKRAARAGR